MNRRPRGYKMLELMLALTTGLLVVAAALTFLVAHLNAQGRNTRSIRLAAELRAVAEVINTQLRHARHDPNAVLNLGENGDDDDGDGLITARDNTFAVNPFELVRVSGAGQADDGDPSTIDGTCIQFAYGDASGAIFGSIALVQVGGRGVIRLNHLPDHFPDCGSGIDLGSAQLDIDLFAFNFDVAESPTDTDDELVRISIGGRLVSDPGTRRKFVESIRLRAPRLPTPPRLPVQPGALD